jgi:hypothetical protein
MTEKQLVKTINLYYRGVITKETREGLRVVLRTLTDEEQKRVLSQVTFLDCVGGDKKKSDDGPLGMIGRLCRPGAPAHSFEYLMILSHSAHNSRENFHCTIAHEIAHFLLGHDFEKPRTRAEEDKWELKVASWLVAHGFIPDRPFPAGGTA